MTFQEIIDSNVSKFGRTDEYENMGIELIENTPEEISDVVNEQIQRLNGTWQETAEDEELQKKFWSSLESSSLHGVIRARIGAKFLKQNSELLGF